MKNNLSNLDINSNGVVETPASNGNSNDNVDVGYCEDTTPQVEKSYNPDTTTTGNCENEDASVVTSNSDENGSISTDVDQNNDTAQADGKSINDDTSSNVAINTIVFFKLPTEDASSLIEHMTQTIKKVATFLIVQMNICY